MMLATPIFYPIILKLGYRPYMVRSVYTAYRNGRRNNPAVAINVFVVRNVTQDPLGVIYRGVIPFLLSFVFIIFLLFVFPQMALFIPSFLR
jgi:TRAP-type C4-dicarboxylate transport system permease large subunit